MSRVFWRGGIFSLLFFSQLSLAGPPSIDCGDLDMNVCRQFLDRTETTRQSLNFEEDFRFVVLDHNEFPRVPLRIMHDSRGFFTPIYAGASNAEVWNLAHYVNLRMHWDPVFMPPDGMLPFGPGVGLYQANNVLRSMLQWAVTEPNDRTSPYVGLRLFLSSFYFGSPRMTSLGQLDEAIFPVSPEVNASGRVTNFTQLETSGIVMGRHLRIPAERMDTSREVGEVLDFLFRTQEFLETSRITIECHSSNISDCLRPMAGLWICIATSDLRNAGIRRIVLSDSIREVRSGAGILAWPMLSRDACDDSYAPEHAPFFNALRDQLQVSRYNYYRRH